MKHKQSEAGFALYLIFILVVVLAVIGYSGWYVYMHRVATTNGPEDAFFTDTTGVDPSELSPGNLEVQFKDATTYDQALSLLAANNVTVEKPEQYLVYFTPVAYRGIKKDTFAAVLGKLHSYPEVASATDDSADPVNNRAGNDEYWLKVVWNQNVTSERIKEIEIATGMGAPTQPNGTNRTMSVKVPVGHEKEYIKKLKNSPLVLDAQQKQIVRDILQ